MIKIGMIVEYNPLHNGHLYLYNKIKSMYPDSLVIAIISSEFTSRGELNVFDKFTRTSHALNMGVDLVLSNPLYHSMNKASNFAYSSVYYLNNAHVDKIICGSETNDITLLDKMYELESNQEFKEHLNNLINEGYSFKSSYLKSFEYFNINFKSNDILAFFYYKAIKEINSNISLELIQRVSNDFNDKTLNSSLIQSATALRENSNNIESYVPSFVYETFNNQQFRDINKLTNLFLYSSLFNQNVRENNEGVLNKLKNTNNIKTYQDIINTLKSKRYSTTTLQRLVVSALLNIEPNYKRLDSNYIRVLGFNNNGREYLNIIKKETQIYTSIKNGINREFDIEILASKILDMVYQSDLVKKELKGPIKV